jgi:hypothetical protein
LAQETLVAVWSRSDYSFEKEEDFLRVCYGFAARVCQQSYRHALRNTPLELGEFPAPMAKTGGLRGAEVNVLLTEILRVGASELRAQEWALIAGSVESKSREDLANELELGNANRTTVRLHRARRKLALLTGWLR